MTASLKINITRKAGAWLSANSSGALWGILAGKQSGFRYWQSNFSVTTGSLLRGCFFCFSKHPGISHLACLDHVLPADPQGLHQSGRIPKKEPRRHSVQWTFVSRYVKAFETSPHAGEAPSLGTRDHLPPQMQKKHSLPNHHPSLSSTACDPG